MLKEFLEYFAGLAVKAGRSQIVPIEGEPDHRYAVLKPDGSLDMRTAEPEPRGHRALDLDTVARFIVDGSERSKTPACWYHRSGVVCLLDDGTRRDRLSMPLELSPQLRLLQLLEANPKAFQQRAMVSLLRIQLAGCHARVGNLVENLRKMKFRKNAEGASELAQGKASIGRSLTMEMTGEQTIPEDITLDVPVFLGQTWRADVLCSLEADPATETFTLTPLAGAVEQAQRTGEAKMAAALSAALAEHKGQTVPIYYGMP